MSFSLSFLRLSILVIDTVIFFVWLSITDYIKIVLPVNSVIWFSFMRDNYLLIYLILTFIFASYKAAPNGRSDHL